MTNSQMTKSRRWLLRLKTTGVEAYAQAKSIRNRLARGQSFWPKPSRLKPHGCRAGYKTRSAQGSGDGSWKSSGRSKPSRSASSRQPPGKTGRKRSGKDFGVTSITQPCLGFEQGCAVQPGGQGIVGGEVPGLSCQGGEHVLGDLLGSPGIPDATQGCAIDQVQMPAHHGRERRLVAPPREVAQPREVL